MRGLATVALVAAMLAVSPAHAQGASNQPSSADVATARDLFREGARAAQAGRWEEARAAYEKSYALRPSSLTRYSLAVAQKETGRLVDALESFRAFLRDPMDAASSQYREPAQTAITELEGRIGWVVVSQPAGPAHLEITIDGVRVPEASLGVRRPLDPGRHRLEATAQGHAPFSKEFDVGPGTSTDIAVRLEPITGAPAASSSAVADAGAPRAAQGSRRKTLGAGLAIGGGALLVGGVVVGLIGVSKASNAETRDGSDADSARALAVVGDITGGVGIVALAVGGYLLFSKPSPQASQTAWAPWVSSTAAGVSMGGAF